MWIVRILQRLLRIPFAIIWIAFFAFCVVTYPLWWILFGAEFDDVQEFSADVWEFLENVTDPDYDWSYVPPPDDNAGW